MKVWMLCLLLVIAVAESAKILIAIPFSGKSHYISNRRIGLELARRGHDVYVITTFTENTKPQNYHEIVVPFKHVMDFFEYNFKTMKHPAYLPYFIFAFYLHESGIRHSEWTLNSTEVRDFLAEDHKFDAVIVEVFSYDMFYYLAHYYDAPLILVTTFGNSLRTNFLTRNPTQLSTTLHEYGEQKDSLSLWGRLVNVYYILVDLIVLNLYTWAKQRNIATEYLKLREPIPSVQELTANASLVLLNSHFSADGPTAYLPNVVEVGGIHLENSTTPLPEDIQRFMDSAEHGVVLLSFGSVISSENLESDKTDAIVKMLGKLKQKVIMKWNTPNTTISDNILVKSWIPQKDILAHPNLKLFISHGGLIGTQEAIYFGVPILGIPAFGDQLNNIMQARKLGYAELLEIVDISEDSLEALLSKMLSTDTYKNKAVEASKRFTDRPMSALDTAVYWIEYVVRYKGAHFIKSPGLEISYISFYNLDVILCIILIICASTSITFYTLKCIFKRIFEKKNTSVSKSKKTL